MALQRGVTWAKVVSCVMSMFACAMAHAVFLYQPPILANGTQMKSLFAPVLIPVKPILHFGQQGRAQMKLQNNTNSDERVRIDITSLRFEISSASPTYQVPVSCIVPAPVLVPKQTTVDVELRFTGLPQYVCAGAIKFDMALTNVAVGTRSAVTATPQEYGVAVMVVPNDPVGKVLPIVPQELVVFACIWAHGATSGMGASQLLASKVFDSKFFTWDPLKKSHWLDSGDVFNLTDLINSMFSAPSATRLVNSRDVAAFLCLLNQSLGTPAKMLRYRTVGRDTFLTNRVASIGKSRVDNASYKETKLDFHQVAMCDGLVYDASLAYKLDLFGAALKAPAQGWDPIAYWQTHLSGDSWTGLANRLEGSALGETLVPTMTEFPVRAWR